MEIRNVVIRDEDGNTLRPQTSFAGVVDADAKRLDEWRKEVDAALSSAGGSSFYWVPAHFVEVINSNNTVHIVTIIPNPLDADKAARLECVMNLDGTVTEGSSNNIFVGYTPLVTQEAIDELAARVTALEGQE